MQVNLNGKQVSCTQGEVLAALLLREALTQDQSYAVAVNSEIVPKSEHVSFVLEEGMVIEVFSMVAGG